MPTPFELSYWQDEADEMYEELLPLFIAALAAGMDGGIDTLPANIQPLVNPVRFNEAAAKYAREYRYTYIRDITETTRTQVQSIMDGWIQSGTSLDALEAQLSGIFGESRAERIAATEVTRAFSQGNMATWESTGFVRSMVWHTAEDEKVCVVCESHSGEHVGIGDIDAAPPNGSHPGCRCWLQPEVDLELVNEQLDEILGL
jgi:SPP1 gp7 family putative phage head morphogenesis protein